MTRGERLKRLHADPEFAAKVADRGRERFKSRRDEMQRKSNAARRGYDVPPALEAQWKALKRKRIPNTEIADALGLTKEKKMVLLNLSDKGQIYAAALIEAIEIAANAAGKPDINAALAALSYTQAVLISKITDRGQRRLAVKACDTNLSAMTAKQVNDAINGIKPSIGGKDSPAPERHLDRKS